MDSKVVVITGASSWIGAWLGWELGAVVSLFTAIVVGMVGTGVGLYAAQRISRRLLP